MFPHLRPKDYKHDFHSEFQVSHFQHSKPCAAERSAGKKPEKCVKVVKRYLEIPSFKILPSLRLLQTGLALSVPPIVIAHL